MTQTQSVSKRLNRRLEQLRRFQKCLRRATAASSPGEAQAAEAAARRLMQIYGIDPLKLTDYSLYDYVSFADNALLLKLREERRATKPRSAKPSPKPTAPVFNTKPRSKPEPVFNTKPRSDRNRDRHPPGYMREYMRNYMRRRRAKQKAD